MITRLRTSTIADIGERGRTLSDKMLVHLADVCWTYRDLKRGLLTIGIVARFQDRLNNGRRFDFEECDRL